MSRGYHAIETASRDEITALQTERMKWSLRHTYENVPYFKAKCEAHGAHPDDFQSLGDLARFPFTSKEDLRRNYPFGLFAVPMAQVVRLHASSGTTGKPTVVGYTREANEADIGQLPNLPRADDWRYLGMPAGLPQASRERQQGPPRHTAPFPIKTALFGSASSAARSPMKQRCVVSCILILMS